MPSASVNAVKKVVYTGTGSTGNQSVETYFSCSQPSLAAGFSPSTIIQDQASTLTFTISQVNGNPLSQAGFTDNLPAGLQVAANPNITNTCSNGSVVQANPNNTSFSFSGFSLSYNNTFGPICTFSLDLTNRAGLTNTSCASSPADFTQAANNLTTNTFNPNGISTCLVINYQQPVISSFSPGKGGEWRPVVITGLHFRDATGVGFGGVIAKSYTVDSDTQITAVVDTGASGIISVVTPGGTANSLNSFTYLANSLFLPVTVH